MNKSFVLSRLLRISGLFALTILLLGCIGDSSEISVITSQPPSCTPRNEAQIEYAELGLAQEAGIRPQVADLIFTTDNKSLLVAYATDSGDPFGQFIRLELTPRRIATSENLGILSFGLTHFTADSRRLISAAPITCPLNMAGNSACWGLFQWATDNLQRQEISEGPNLALHSFAVSRDGNWLLKSNVLDSTLFSFDQLHGTRFTAGIDPENGLQYSRINGALSSTSHLIAVGIRVERLSGEILSGAVQVEQWDGKNASRIPRQGWWFGPDDLTDINGLELDGVPLDLTFDSTDRWLGAQTENSVYIFDVLSFGATRRRTSSSPTSLGVLRFNPLSSLIAGGHAKGLAVWSVPELRLVLDEPGGQVSAIAFSPDGCLLAWGDVEGTVHIINAPKP